MLKSGAEAKPGEGLAGTTPPSSLQLPLPVQDRIMSGGDHVHCVPVRLEQLRGMIEVHVENT